MPKDIKEQIKEDMLKRLDEQGLGPGFFDKICDETIATTAADVRAFMEKVDHPALKMEDMYNYA